MVCPVALSLADHTPSCCGAFEASGRLKVEHVIREGAVTARKVYKRRITSQ